MEASVGVEMVAIEREPIPFLSETLQEESLPRLFSHLPSLEFWNKARKKKHTKKTTPCAP